MSGFGNILVTMRVGIAFTESTYVLQSSVYEIIKYNDSSN